MAPTRARGGSKRRAAKKALPPYNFNSKGEAIILPLEKRCRFGGCKRRFTRYHRLNLHVRQEHGLKVSGPMRIGKQHGDMEKVIDWMERVFEKGERGVPAPDVWSEWPYKIPKQAQEYYDYLKMEEEKKKKNQEKEGEEAAETTTTTQATSAVANTDADGEEASLAANTGAADEDDHEKARAMLQAMKIDDDDDDDYDDYEEEY
ncbi:hypothetical protein F5X96DRAFT_674746 [Biscogniauxia mediterranea]|nr:hypothetical protein F5X96DRAFT_674746 [Biscogniauxia mediterranea]